MKPEIIVKIIANQIWGRYTRETPKENLVSKNIRGQ